MTNSIKQARDILSAELLRSLLVNLPAAVQAIDVLLAATDPAKYVVQQWQPIETAPESQDVLVQRSTGDMSVAHRFNGHWFIGTLQLSWPQTHWMPLPAAPKQGGAE